MLGIGLGLNAQDGVALLVVGDLIGRDRRTNQECDERRQRDRTVRRKNDAFVRSEFVLELLGQDVVGAPMRGVELIRRKWRCKWHQNQRDERERQQPAGRVAAQALEPIPTS